MAKSNKLGKFKFKTDREMYTINSKTNCWIGSYAPSSLGYSIMRRSNKTIFLHRYFYEKFKGLIPKDKCLDHLCRNNRGCVNPDHLEAVTIGDRKSVV